MIINTFFWNSKKEVIETFLECVASAFSTKIVLTGNLLMLFGRKSFDIQQNITVGLNLLYYKQDIRDWFTKLSTKTKLLNEQLQKESGTNEEFISLTYDNNTIRFFTKVDIHCEILLSIVDDKPVLKIKIYNAAEVVEKVLNVITSGDLLSLFNRAIEQAPNAQIAASLEMARDNISELIDNNMQMLQQIQAVAMQIPENQQEFTFEISFEKINTDNKS